MYRRAAFDKRLRNGLVRLRLKGGGQFVEEPGDVIVECRCVEVLCRWQLLYLIAPAREQDSALLPDKCGQFIGAVIAHLAIGDEASAYTIVTDVIDLYL